MLPEVEYRYFLDDLIDEKAPLMLFVEQLRHDAPEHISKILVYSTYWDKKEWGWWYKRRRRFHDDKLRFWLNQRRKIQPKVQASHDTIRVFYTAENCYVDMKYAEYAFGFQTRDEVDYDPHYFQLPYYAYYGDLEGLTADDRQDYLAQLPEKTQFCDFVYNHHVDEREALYDLINSYQKVTAPSRSRNNAPPIGEGLSTSESRNVINWRQLRIDYGKQFKFSIACENEQYPGYITEKIVSAFKAGSIPIYRGAPDIAEHFNPKAFINANELSNDALLAKIKQLNTDEHMYQKMLNEPPITQESSTMLFQKLL